MTVQHKAALAAGRDEGRAVKAYLETLEQYKPKRGRRRTSESIERQLAQIDESLPDADPLTRLKLHQRRLDLRAEKFTSEQEVDLSEFEDAFVAVAASYSARRGITYSAWRACGVPASVLQRAGIARTRSAYDTAS